MRDRRDSKHGACAVCLFLVLSALAVLPLLPLPASPNVPSAPGPRLQVGEPAPNFEVRDLNGEKIELANLRGRPVWINFWSTTCVPCKAEIPDLIRVSGEAEFRDVRLLALDMGEERGRVVAYLTENGYRALPVSLFESSSIATSYGIDYIPAHVFIDSRGIVRAVHTGKLDAAEMRARLRDLDQGVRPSLPGWREHVLWVHSNRVHVYDSQPGRRAVGYLGELRGLRTQPPFSWA